MRRVHRFLGALRADRRGGVASFLGIAIIPIVAAIGLSVDAGRGWLVKSRLSSAIDAAGLAGGRVITSPSRDDDIRMFFKANFPTDFMDATVNGPNISVDPGQTTITINATATIPTTFMRVVGIKEVTVRADTVVKRKGMELVLVIDNTGSMVKPAPGDTRKKIDAVKDAAHLLVDAVYGNRDTVENLWVGVVPYVAAVNIGTDNLHKAWTVDRATPSYTVDLARKKVGTAGTSTSTVCATVQNNGIHTFYDGQIIDISGASDDAFNVRTVIRLTSTTDCSITQSGGGSQRNKKFWYIIPNTTTSTPATSQTGVTARVPATDYSQGGSWSGCVEARVTPYEEDQAETLADTNSPSTIWSRYYWPSTRGIKFFQNDKKTQQPLVTPPSNAPTIYTSQKRYGDNDWGKGYNNADGTKWAAMNPAIITEDSITKSMGGDYWAYGPNFGCGTPILPLQPYRNKVEDSIEAMRAWGRSGTMSNLGLAWGWRVISPIWKDKWAGVAAGHPVAYDEVGISKVVVLLTDGVNEWVDYSAAPGCSGLSNCTGSDGLPTDADYTAYGRLAEGRMGTTSSTTATTTINNRMKSLCTAMKANKIAIYTVVLQENDAATRQIFKDCATDPSMAFFPGNDADLQLAFKKIGASITKLRLAL